MVLDLQVEKNEYELIVAALSELPLKAIPGQFRNNLIVKLQKQAETPQEVPPCPDSPNALSSSSIKKTERAKKSPATSTPVGE